jgi:hypothetical protein
VDRLADMGVASYFVMRSMEMQLLLWCALADWLGIFYMMRIIYRRGVFSMSQYCGSSSIPGIMRKAFCIVRKGEKHKF